MAHQWCSAMLDKFRRYTCEADAHAALRENNIWERDSSVPLAADSVERPNGKTDCILTIKHASYYFTKWDTNTVDQILGGEGGC